MDTHTSLQLTGYNKKVELSGMFSTFFIMVKTYCIMKYTAVALIVCKCSIS